MKTLRSWCNLGDWENLRGAETKTELDRLKDLRSSLLDRAEAQMKEGKLPHTEIGLMYKLERMIDQSRAGAGAARNGSAARPQAIWSPNVPPGWGTF